MYDVITIGDATFDTFLVIDDATINCDLKSEECKLCLNYADKLPIRHSTQSMGGDAANVAVGLTKLGLKTAIVTELGDDLNGHVIKQGLEEAKVNTEMVRILKDKETRYSVVLNFKAERTILSYHAPRTYSLPKLASTQWIYYTSLGKSFEKLQDKLEQYLKKHPETKLAMNPGSYQLKHGTKKIKELFPRTEILFLNKEEAEHLAGSNDVIENLRKLHAQGPHTVVITDSTKGSYCFNGNRPYFMPVYPVIPRAKTGAGDAFASGFLACIVNGDPAIPDAIQWGTANAAGVIQHFGAQTGLLDRKGITRLIKKFPKIIPTIV